MILTKNCKFILFEPKNTGISGLGRDFPVKKAPSVPPGTKKAWDPGDKGRDAK